MNNHPNRSKKKRRVKHVPTARTRAKPVASSPPAKQKGDLEHDRDYAALLTGVSTLFGNVTLSATPLFCTDATDLNQLYLDSLPSDRQVHNCSACRRFIETFGGLAKVADNGELVPAMWNPEYVVPFYQPAFEALAQRVRSARITTVFRSSLDVWGTPQTGPWSHISVRPPSELIYRGKALTPDQAMAAHRENVLTVRTALKEFKPAVLDELLRVLNADVLARSEKFVGPMQWLRDLHDRPRGPHGDNLLNRAVAMAPEGYCHPRASVMAPLLQNIVDGLPFNQIKSKFEAMMHPLRYQRPQAAPAAGNIAAAEALVERFGVQRSLPRRYARLDEVTATWWPTVPDQPSGGAGVFAAVKAKNSIPFSATALPDVTMTWEKFSRTALRGANHIEMLVPPHGSFIQLTTAVNEDAPPIIKWDGIEGTRNPVALYLYHGGSYATQFGLQNGWRAVTAIVQHPAVWGARPLPQLAGKGVILLLDGAKDTRRDQGLGLFPENMRTELHGARATIEAFSKVTPLGDIEGPAAAGYYLGQGGPRVSLRAFDGKGWSSFTIDRWD